MRVQSPLSSPIYWRVGDATRRTIELYLSTSRDIPLIQRLRGAPWDVFHDPTLGTFDKIRIARDALAASPDPMVAVHKMIF